MKDECKYCRNLKKSSNKKTYQKGGWNPKKEAGLILAHGNIINDSFVVIPEGIELRPLAHIGNNYNLSHLFQYMDNLNNPIGRFNGFDSEESNEYSGRIYRSGDVIPDMTLHFKMIWRRSRETPSIRENDIGYFYSGVLTNATISEEYMKMMIGHSSELDTTIMKDSMSHNDDSVGIEWDSTLTLGNVLKKIVDANVQGKFWLLACRPGDIVKAERACGKNMMRNRLKQSIDADFFNHYTLKLKTIKDDWENTKSNVDLLNNNKHLIQIFLNNLYNYIVFKSSKDNNFTINTDLLCDVNEIYDKRLLKSTLVNKTRDKLVFFIQFWKEYAINYDNKHNETIKDNKNVKRVKHHSEFAFKFN